MKKIKISFALNILIVLLVTVGCICMFTGIKFMPSSELLESRNIEMFKFFTVDSNILVGIMSLILAIYEYLYLKKKIDKIPKWTYISKYISTCAISLTFFTTLLFLTSRYGFYALYNNSNLFFHLLVPLLAFISYIIYEKYDADYKESLFGLVPMLIYAVYYTGNIFTHLSSGGLTIKYDFYGFLFGNINNIYIVVPMIFSITYIMSLLILFLNNNINN